MAEQFQIVIAVKTMSGFRLVELVDFGFQVLPHPVGQLVDVRIIGVEGAAIQSTPLADIGYSDLIELFGLQQVDKSALDSLHGCTPAPVIFGVHVAPPLIIPTLVWKLVIVFLL